MHLNALRKSAFGHLLYAPNSVAVEKGWGAPENQVLMQLAATLDEHKGQLWSLGKPKRGRPRFAHTLCGT